MRRQKKKKSDQVNKVKPAVTITVLEIDITLVTNNTEHNNESNKAGVIKHAHLIRAVCKAGGCGCGA